MKIIVDAMGGDNAPGAIVQGALEAHKAYGSDIILVGRTAEILRAVEAGGEKNLPAGVEIRDADAGCPTLTYNTIGRHQSSIVRTRVCSSLSPWLMETAPGGIYSVPISHGEGRFAAPESVLKQLAENGQIATQYVDPDGVPAMDTAWNPNGSLWAIEGITSPDGRVLGKMGHSERIGPSLYRNVPGNYDMGLFRSAAKYFR